LVVPEAALIRRGELTAVNVLVAEGRPQLRQVRVGLPAGNGLVEVLAGLTEGERVAMDPLAAR
jgi:multidrug efflux pump subunit AcrA (membrane-fusion protein)